MSSLGYTEHTLASAVADDATVAIAYPSGHTRASLSLATGGKLVIDDGRYGSWNEDADPGFTVTFGASTITITNKTGFDWPAGSVLLVSFGDTPRVGSYNVTVGADPQQAKRGAGSQELTASGAVNPGVSSVELSHPSTIIAATIETALAHQGLFVVKNTSASGSAAHKVTLAHGTWDGTNNVVTLDAPNECVVIWFDSAGNGTVVENVGTAVFS